MSTSLTRLHDVFDLAMRVGELMISYGAAASDVTATMLRITASSGIRNVSVQVTMTDVSVSYLPDNESTPFTRIRSATSYGLDYAKLDAVDDIARGYTRGDIELQDARSRVNKLWAKGRHYNGWITNGAWGLMGAACALIFGGGTLAIAFAALAAGLLAQLLASLGTLRLPEFYVNVIGGLFSVGMAFVAHSLDPSENASLVVVACIVLILAGLTSVGAMQDAITGWYVTGAARLLQTFVLTVACIIGVRGGLLIAEALGVSIYVNADMPRNLVSIWVLALGGALIGLGYSVGAQLPLRLLPWNTVLACLTATGSVLLEEHTLLQRSWAVGIMSTVAGFTAVIIAQRAKTPPMVIAAAGIITMVPGSVIYRGLLDLGTNSDSGFSMLLLAGEIAIAISTGVVLGQFLAARTLEMMPQRGSFRTSVFAAPFSTNRRRRLTTFGRTRRRPGALTSAIPVVHLDPGELDPTIDWSEGPGWREDFDNLKPDTYTSGFELNDELRSMTPTTEFDVVEGTREAAEKDGHVSRDAPRGDA